MSARAPTVGDATGVAIIGAGPYALALAAHLQALGVEHRIFGLPMHSWRTQMPSGMFLKSDGFTSNLHEPLHQFTLEHYCAEQRLPYAAEGVPVGLATFCAYGMAFQRRFVPHLEPQQVTALAPGPGGFALRLADGQQVHARQVVAAIGVSHFERMPKQLAALPASRCSHSSACKDPDAFIGRDVTVVGGGASALDLAGLLAAGGARVRLVVRKPSVEFHAAPGKPRSLWQRLRHPRSGLGHSLRSLVYCELPGLFRYLPQALRLRIVRRHLGPAAGWFVREQVIGKVTMLLGHAVVDARERDGRVCLRLGTADGAISEVVTDHVIAATGYEVDLRRVPFLAAELLSRLRMVAGTPVLSAHFETSVPGLHVIGPAAANTFGPVMRFAIGARFAAERLAPHLAREARRHARSPVLADTVVAAPE